MYGKSGSSIEKIDDVVKSEPKDKPQCDVVIVGVMQLDVKICYNCKGRVESTSPALGRCSKCLMTQCMMQCSDQVFAKLLVRPQKRWRDDLTRIWKNSAGNG